MGFWPHSFKKSGWFARFHDAGTPNRPGWIYHNPSNVARRFRQRLQQPGVEAFFHGIHAIFHGRNRTSRLLPVLTTLELGAIAPQLKIQITNITQLALFQQFFRLEMDPGTDSATCQTFKPHCPCHISITQLIGLCSIRQYLHAALPCRHSRYHGCPTIHGPLLRRDPGVPLCQDSTVARAAANRTHTETFSLSPL